MTTTKCQRCGRPLRSEASIARGRGRHCERMARREAAVAILVRPFKGAQAAADKALALLAEGALVPTRFEGQYLAVASDGVGTYLVDTGDRSCTCKGHARTGRCYHLVAADAAEISTARRSAYALAA